MLFKETPKEKHFMDGKLFGELIESVKEAGQIMRNEKMASRTFEYTNLDHDPQHTLQILQTNGN
jgi:hypothetical protein